VKEHRYVVAGEQVRINVVEREEDLEGFRDFVRANLRRLAVDTEGTGLNMYAPSFRVRLIQFGNTREAWVLPVEIGGQILADAIKALRVVDKWVLQNAPWDLQVFDRVFGVKLEEMWPKVTDTQLLAKIIDPRPAEKGGIGASLEDLTKFYISKELAENVKGLMGRLAREHRTTKEKIFEKIDLFHPDFTLYAGMDAILAARLLDKQLRKIPKASKHLIKYEHKVAEVCSYMSRTGFLLDVEYSEKLSAQLLADQERWSEVALDYGVENVNSIDQVAQGLLSMGVKLRERTANGKFKVDKKILEPLIEAENPLAIAVKEAKKAGKWRTTWVDTFLSTRDENDRCHASINTLQARTGRMSITGIPAQTLPSSDWMIRRCFLADEGHLIGSVDYMAQELRVLAALSGDPTMTAAFAKNADLHQMTADSAGVSRKVGKTTNFAYVYGSGAGNIAEQCGIPVEVAKKVIKGFESTYPMVKAYSQHLQQVAREQGYITTANGRILPVDRDRPYSALNYMIQSSSRDVTCRGILKLHEAGFTPYIRLPIHDEVLASLPAQKAEWGALEIAKYLAEDMGKVWIGTEPEVGLRSWGSLYVKEEDKERLLGTVVI
jgi:DNA polymerase-1